MFQQQVNRGLKMKTTVTNIVNIVTEDEIDAGKLQEQFEVSKKTVQK